MDRRRFLASAVALAATRFTTPSNAAAAPGRSLPTVRWGKHDITRILVGHNPIKGVSHFTDELSREMRQYFADDAAHGLALLRRCQEVGINACQIGFRPGERDLIEGMLRNHYREGGTLKWIASFYAMPTDAAAARQELDQILKMDPRPIGIQQVGNTTDALLKDGKIDLSLENLKRFRDAGLLVGLGSHNREAIDRAESKGWDLDFYQCSLYRSWFSPKPQRRGELFEEEDRRAMAKTIRQVSKPCIAFKVLGGNRHCASRQSLEDALRFAFDGIKRTDVVLLGMWQKYKDQPAQNAAIVQRLLA